MSFISTIIEHALFTLPQAVAGVAAAVEGGANALRRVGEAISRPPRTKTVLMDTEQDLHNLRTQNIQEAKLRGRLLTLQGRQKRINEYYTAERTMQDNLTQVAQLKNDIIQLQNELTQTAGEVEDHQADIARSQQKVTSLQDSLNLLEASKARSVNELHLLQDQLADLQTIQQQEQAQPTTGWRHRLGQFYQTAKSYLVTEEIQELPLKKQLDYLREQAVKLIAASDGQIRELSSALDAAKYHLIREEAALRSTQQRHDTTADKLAHTKSASEKLAADAVRMRVENKDLKRHGWIPEAAEHQEMQDEMQRLKIEIEPIQAQYQALLAIFVKNFNDFTDDIIFDLQNICVQVNTINQFCQQILPQEIASITSQPQQQNSEDLEYNSLIQLAIKLEQIREDSKAVPACLRQLQEQYQQRCNQHVNLSWFTEEIALHNDRIEQTLAKFPQAFRDAQSMLSDARQQLFPHLVHAKVQRDKKHYIATLDKLITDIDKPLTFGQEMVRALYKFSGLFSRAFNYIYRKIFSLPAPAANPTQIEDVSRMDLTPQKRQLLFLTILKNEISNDSVDTHQAVSVKLKLLIEAGKKVLPRKFFFSYNSWQDVLDKLSHLAPLPESPPPTPTISPTLSPEPMSPVSHASMESVELPPTLPTLRVQ